MKTAVVSEYAAPGALHDLGEVWCERALRDLAYRRGVSSVVLAGDAAHYTYSRRIPALTVFRAPEFRCAESGVPDSVVADCPSASVPPFSYRVWDGEGAETFSTRNPELPELTDFHIHTRFAYCCENMDAEKTLRIARAVNLRHFGFSEHSSHLYFPKEGLSLSLENPHGRARADGYCALLREYADGGFALRGMELDIDAAGTPCVEGQDRAALQYMIGAVHQVSQYEDPVAFRREFLFRAESAARAGARILAHPMRLQLFRKVGFPREAMVEIVELLKRCNMAAELNCHNIDAVPEFYALCVERGVRISLGSDSHNLADIGCFTRHMEILKEIGALADPERTLFSSAQVCR